MTGKETPVLNTLRALLAFKDSTSIAEVAGTSGLPRKTVLDVINRNGNMVWRERKSGKITKVDPKSVLREKLWRSGAFFRETVHDYGSTTGLCFEGNDELRERLQKQTWGGGLGDSYAYKYIPDTPEIRAELMAAGVMPWSEAVIDDREWSEE